MQVISFLKDVEFSDKNVSIDVMIDDEIRKEIRIAFNKNQIMKEHKSKYPITLMCIEGEINFFVKEKVFILHSGDTISLDANIMHELEATEKSVARLNLIKCANNKIQHILTRK